ncbi:MAG: hypothetical protein KatS3mg131_0947 [Candidatus Tectimicrobiota bacterium]|nr:MAG: hypothetical protein KatS3mg131_0947 [Candidatus Tectomicrobia bacterium]
MIYTLLEERHRQVFERDLELDFSISVEPTLRYRVNVHMQRGNVEAAFRRIEPAVRSIAELNLPAIVKRFAEFPEGLVLVTGPTGAGKTTTVAAMVEHINTTRSAVVITLENPIEYLFTYKRSVIKQREIGTDTHSYPVALREAMRQDPDVIVIGEVRDQETMKAALDAAETGHLVLATFAAANATQSILRTFHFFPKDRQQEIQLQLANCLRGIVSLRLLQRADQAGPGSRHRSARLHRRRGQHDPQRLHRDDSFGHPRPAVAYGMHTFAASMRELWMAGLISRQALATFS